jgi:hypothetical protein
MHSLFTHYSLTIHSLFTHHSLTIHSPCTQHSLTMHSPCTHYAPTIHSPFTHYALTTGTSPLNVSLSGPWDKSTDKSTDGTDLAATIYSLTAGAHAGENSYAATSFAYNNVTGPAVGGPFPLDTHPPTRGPFTGSVVLDAVSVTGLVITPSSSPFPPPTPPPAPPPPTPTCCHASCSSGKCHTTGFCVESQDSCEKHCDGVWCPP